MNLCIYDPHPTCGGPGTTSMHLPWPTITSTFSGKRVKSMSPRRLQQNGTHFYGGDLTVVKHSELVDALRRYDGVVLAEPRQPHMDKLALKGKCAQPRYLEALRDCSTPFTVQLHALPMYSSKKSPWLRRLLALPNFTGRGVSFYEKVEGAGDNQTLFDQLDWIHSPLPYSGPFGDLHSRGGSAVMTGRVVPAKDHARFVRAAGMRREIWGAAGVGMHECLTHKLMSLASRVEGADATEVPDHYEPHEWEVGDVRYCGAFSDCTRPLNGAALHVSLTRPSLSFGITEWCSLEAMAHRIPTIRCKCHSSGPYQGAVVDDDDDLAAAMIAAREDDFDDQRLVRQWNDPVRCVRAHERCF